MKLNERGGGELDKTYADFLAVGRGEESRGGVVVVVATVK